MDKSMTFEEKNKKLVPIENLVEKVMDHYQEDIVGDKDESELLENDSSEGAGDYNGMMLDKRS